MLRTILSHAFVIASAFFAASIDVSAQEPAHEAIDAVFADLTKPGSPGCALGVYRNGKIIYEKGYGLANLEESVPITPETVFDVGSIAKQFTAASILLLEKRGKLRVDDDVRKYIPELPNYFAQSGRKITILQLLNHTSGVRDYGLLFLAGVNPDSVTTNDDALGIIVRQKGLNFFPGSNWQYSNSGYLLLSLVVERVSGKSLRDFANENIFLPLGMTHTQYRNDHTTLILHRALGYDRNEKGDYTLSVSYAEETGDGSVHTSIEDLQKWDENFYSAQIGGKDFVANMEESGKLGDGTAIGYAKGLFIDDYRGLRTIWHGGTWAGYRTYLVRVPLQHFSVACLCNVSNARPWSRAKEVVNLYLADTIKPEATGSGVNLAPEQVNALAGLYQNHKTADVLRVVLKHGQLQADFGDGMFNLRPVTSTLFYLLDFRPLETSLKFEAGHDSKPRQFIVTRDRERPALFEAVDEPKVAPVELSGYVGDYWSDELHATYRLAMKNGELWLRDLIGGDGLSHANIIPFAQLRPVSRDEFDLNGANLVLHFTRDKKGDITGFALNGFRERGMLFTYLRHQN